MEPIPRLYAVQLSRVNKQRRSWAQKTAASSFKSARYSLGLRRTQNQAVLADLDTIDRVAPMIAARRAIDSCRDKRT